MKVSDLMKGEDVVEIFGDTGTCKTTVAIVLAKEYLEAKKKVLYLDTEKNINVIPEGMEYIYAPDFNEMLRVIVGIKDKKYDLVILDSLGAPAVGAFATSSMKERGEMLLNVTSALYLLKIYANKHNANIFVCNQPESVFNKQPGYVLQPWGDKSNYFAKEVWRTSLLMTTPMMTTVQVTAFKCRRRGRGDPLFKVTVSKSGVVIQ